MLASRETTSRFILFPLNMHDVSRIKTDFQGIANFPNVVGVVDGTQVQMCRMHMSIEWDIILSIPR
ncbi:hypothetical protein DPMN_150920 [Dreissena polymorpha]|uniref:Uncharacterized protein n=1 Tax=Dreissena polymorpha TaxID=45954 RepID=A0A9D4FG66_DREPO|nr:hypothetical protein DPMN_150920 [Dreissena polymorpha]